MLNFAKSKTFTAQYDLETITKTFNQGLDSKVKRCLVYAIKHIISLSTHLLFNIEKHKFE